MSNLFSELRFPDPAALADPAVYRVAGVLAAVASIEALLCSEAIDKLDDYVDAAYIAQMPFVRIIHGKGTGRLREAVRRALKENLNVQSYEGGKRGEGGDGVTVVKFKK